MPKNKGFSIKDILNSQSKAESAPAAVSPSDNFVVYDIPLDKIIPAQGGKNFYGIRGIEELAASIEQSGLRQNLEVRKPDANGNYEIISGERRYTALKLLGWKTAPCTIEEEENELALDLILIDSNATIRKPTSYEKVEEVKRTQELMRDMEAAGHKFKGRKRKLAAKYLGMSEAQVGRMESIDKNLTPELKKAFEREEIGISKAYEASLLSQAEQTAAYEKFQATGELNTKKDPPPAPTVTQPPIVRNENPAADNVTETITNMEDKEIAAILKDGRGNTQHRTGNLAIAAAVCEETGRLSGGIMGEASAPLAYIALAGAVCAECIMRLDGDEGAMEEMKRSLAALFDKPGK